MGLRAGQLQFQASLRDAGETGLRETVDSKSTATVSHRYAVTSRPEALNNRAGDPTNLKSPKENVQTPRARKSPGAGEAQPKLLGRTRWVANPIRKR